MYKLQPISPTANRLLQQEFDQTQYDKHKDKIRSVQPSIDSKPPKIYGHVEVNLRRLQLENDRLTKVDTENRRLLKALISIAESPATIDSRNEYETKNLRVIERMKNGINIVRQNERIVNRLINLKPTVDRQKLKNDWENRERLMANISRYKHPWRDGKQLQRSYDDLDFMPVQKNEEKSVTYPKILLKQPSRPLPRHHLSGRTKSVDSIPRIQNEKSIEKSDDSASSTKIVEKE